MNLIKQSIVSIGSIAFFSPIFGLANRKLAKQLGQNKTEAALCGGIFTSLMFIFPDRRSKESDFNISRVALPIILILGQLAAFSLITKKPLQGSIKAIGKWVIIDSFLAVFLRQAKEIATKPIHILGVTILFGTIPAFVNFFLAVKTVRIVAPLYLQNILRPVQGKWLDGIIASYSVIFLNNTLAVMWLKKEAFQKDAHFISISYALASILLTSFILSKGSTHFLQRTMKMETAALFSLTSVSISYLLSQAALSYFPPTSPNT
ncbi:MAG: hypothetical protein HYZ47_02730 [Simkania negevensis]|nr:hypothetical protein [Simkania negevensis]